MADQKALSVVKALVDEIELAVVPSSASYYDGHSKAEVKGTDNGTVVFSENMDEAVGMIKYDIYATTENAKLIDIIRNRKFVSSKILNDDGSFSKTMKVGTLMNDTDDTLGPDGKITLHFKGTPLYK